MNLIYNSEKINCGVIIMKKISNLKRYPMHSISYKLQKLNMLHGKINLSTLRIGLSPIWFINVYESLLPIEIIPIVLVCDILDGICIYKCFKEKGQLKDDIVEQISKIEPNVILTDEDKKILKKEYN